MFLNDLDIRICIYSYVSTFLINIRYGVIVLDSLYAFNVQVPEWSCCALTKARKQRVSLKISRNSWVRPYLREIFHNIWNPFIYWYPIKAKLKLSFTPFIGCVSLPYTLKVSVRFRHVEIWRNEINETNNYQNHISDCFRAMNRISTYLIFFFC